MGNGREKIDMDNGSYTTYQHCSYSTLPPGLLAVGETAGRSFGPGSMDMGVSFSCLVVFGFCYPLAIGRPTVQML